MADETVMRHASSTAAADYLDAAIDHIDTVLGKGFAEQHSELIAAFMQTAAINMGAAVIAAAIEDLAGVIEDARFAGKRRD